MHVMAAPRILSIFDSIFVQHRLWVILACIFVGLLHGTTSSRTPLVTPLQTLNGAELLNPSVVEPLTRASVLAHLKDSSSDGHGKTQCLMRSERHSAEADTGTHEDAIAQQSSNSFTHVTNEGGDAKSLQTNRDQRKSVPVMRREMSASVGTVKRSSLLLGVAGLVISCLVLGTIFQASMIFLSNEKKIKSLGQTLF